MSKSLRWYRVKQAKVISLCERVVLQYETYVGGIMRMQGSIFPTIL